MEYVAALTFVKLHALSRIQAADRKLVGPNEPCVDLSKKSRRKNYKRDEATARESAFGGLGGFTGGVMATATATGISVRTTSTIFASGILGASFSISPPGGSISSDTGGSLASVCIS